MKAFLLVYILSSVSHGRRMYSPAGPFQKATVRVEKDQTDTNLDTNTESNSKRVLSALLWATHPALRAVPGHRPLGHSTVAQRSLTKSLRRLPIAMSDRDDLHQESRPRVSSSQQNLLRRPDLDSINLKLQDEDPFGLNEANEKTKKENNFTLNKGEAIDRLREDIPLILREEPDWTIFTNELELNLELVDPVAFRMLGTIAPVSKTRVEGLLRNQRAHEQLLQFRKRFVEWDEIDVKVRPALDISGDQSVECRWHARLGLKPFQIPQFPQWASVAVAAAVAAAAVTADSNAGGQLGQLADAAEEMMESVMGEPMPAEVAAAATTAAAVSFLQDKFPNLGYNFATAATQAGDDIVMIDAVSRFHLNSEGKIDRHVIDNVDVKINKEPIRLADVDMFLAMAGIQKAYPKVAVT